MLVYLGYSVYSTVQQAQSGLSGGGDGEGRGSAAPLFLFSTYSDITVQYERNNKKLHCYGGRYGYLGSGVCHLVQYIFLV